MALPAHGAHTVFACRALSRAARVPLVAPTVDDEDLRAAFDTLNRALPVVFWAMREDARDAAPPRAFPTYRVEVFLELTEVAYDPARRRLRGDAAAWLATHLHEVGGDRSAQQSPDLG